MERIPRNLILLYLLLPPLVQGAAATDSTEPLDILDEVLIEATGPALDRLRYQMIRVEDRFFKRYNELNTEDDFDMFCGMEKGVGTNTMHRHCRTEYQVQAMRREAQDYLEAMKEMSDGSGEVRPWGPPTPAIMKRQFKDFQQNMREVVSRDPELVDMLRERYVLGKRYEATHEKLFGPRKPKAEKAGPEARQPP